MRTELENIQKIEQYLEGKLIGSELEQFEAELATNQELRNEVDLQRQITKRINYWSAKQDLEAIHQHLYPAPKPSWTSYFSAYYKTYYALLAGIAIVLVSGWLWWYSSNNNLQNKLNQLVTIKQEEKLNTKANNFEEIEQEKTEKQVDENENQAGIFYPENEDNGQKKEQKKQRFYAKKVVDILYPSKEKKDKQVFKIQANSDTVIIGAKGTKIFVPSEVFVDKAGKIVDNILIDIELIELYDLSDYIKYDLPTISNGKMLESGGVIYLNATRNGEKLAIAKGKGIEVQFNSKNAKKDRMQAFYLERNEDEVNWRAEKKPVKLTGNLLDRNKSISKNKKYSTDILNSKKIQDNVSNRTVRRKDSLFKYIVFKPHQPKKMIAVSQDILRYDLFYKDVVFNERIDIFNRVFAKINDKQYANTFIATVPFRERLEGVFLHEKERNSDGIPISESEILLEIYLDNVDKPLWFADSLVVKKLDDWDNNCELFNPRTTLFRWLRAQNYTEVIVLESADQLQGKRKRENIFELSKAFSQKYDVTEAEWKKSYEFLLHKRILRRGYKIFLKHYNNKKYARFEKDYEYNLVRIAISGRGHWGFEYAAFHGSLKPTVVQVKRPCEKIDNKYENVVSNLFDEGNVSNFARQSVSKSGVIDQNSVSSTFVTQLDWINCDRFYQLQEQNSAELQVALLLPETNAYQPQIYMVFTRLNAVIPLAEVEGKYTTGRIPVGEEVEIIALWHDGNKIFYQKESQTLQKTNHLTMTLQASKNEQEVKNMLASVK